ncbi:hypothetical protein AO068_25795 [Pseudomonas sp. ICMP 3272]|uniref:Uncharacterized protein n=1 Tax=Pseudomonas savastanoi TaxID=29438 RepID=A0AAW3LVQ4_PSESS|nr:hypothetical protein AO068_25795 [Pseudomonas sp. ICMP 3272]KTC56523.1 hypothetical protein AO258_26695 [Pseudomonas syringae ICMP 19498]KTC58092.1 hypothetical protein AO287_11615 [Pseudomonas savastanoi]RMQ14396.1 hypothetical protein ALQ09_00367 [Pseudomonas viridiflava]
MMCALNDVIVTARLNIQRALLGEVSRNLRAVIFSVSGLFLNIRFYFDGEIDDDNFESASCVETEVLADYEDNWTVSVECLRLDASDPILDQGVWVFKRREIQQ